MKHITASIILLTLVSTSTASWACRVGETRTTADCYGGTLLSFTQKCAAYSSGGTYWDTGKHTVGTCRSVLKSQGNLNQ